MTTKVTATQAKAKLLGLLDEVAAGQEVEITRHGRTVARLIPGSGPNALKSALVGVAISAGPEEALFSTDAKWELD